MATKFLPRRRKKLLVVLRVEVGDKKFRREEKGSPEMFSLPSSPQEGTLTTCTAGLEVAN